MIKNTVSLEVLIPKIDLYKLKCIEKDCSKRHLQISKLRNMSVLKTFEIVSIN